LEENSALGRGFGGGGGLLKNKNAKTQTPGNSFPKKKKTVP